MNKRNKKKKSNAGKRLVTAIVVGELIILGSYCLPHASKEGVMIRNANSENTIEDNNAYAETTDDFSYDFANNVVYEKSVYEMISDSGYELDKFPDFQHEVLEMYSYSECENDLGITTTGVNFRLGPTTDYPIIKELKANTTVDLIARINENGWYLVQKDGNLGFVSGDYVREQNSQNIVEQMQNLPELIPVVQATTEVNVRPEPNTDRPEYGRLQLGEYVPMVRLLENGWYEVIYNGQLGYVKGDYVREANVVNGQVQKMVTLAEDTVISDAPYGNEMDVAKLYEAAKIYGEVDQYYYAEVGGYIGYIPKNSCVDLNGTYVIVDISEQTATLYNNTDPVYSTYVVTGDDETPSDIGLFDIDSKERNATLTGPGYSVPVSYWMPYNNGEGLHDATWRGAFGGDYYHYDGSHGCVNMPLEAAGVFFENVSVGDKVLVKR